VVKLQKRFAYTYKGKDHYKHEIIIPERLVEKLGWKEGLEIEPTLDKDKLVFRKLKSHSD
jgi:bifunctional DNA-binding transcriptional regulator/antitoxin component of YhaV-PrlF toxin-antitoxin module